MLNSDTIYFQKYQNAELLKSVPNKISATYF